MVSKTKMQRLLKCTAATYLLQVRHIKKPASQRKMDCLTPLKMGKAYYDQGGGVITT